MFFDNVWFAFFVVLTLIALRLAPAQRRWIVLLVVSYAFCASVCGRKMMVVLAALSWVAWITALWVDRSQDDRAKWRWAITGMATIMVAFAGVRLLGHADQGMDWVPSHIRLTSTLGVSFFSLQAISYVADVYLGRMNAEPNLGKVMVYLALFPKLVQGPIERAPTLMPQLERLHLPTYEALRSAMVLFAWGLFKKVALADRLARVVDPVFASTDNFAGLVPVLAVYAYAFQLYFDFSGYTDMARATARLMGIELSENFRAPYLASSMSDFWRRWHISLSRWLLDYLFTPLQIIWRRYRLAGTAGALFVTFTLSGIWHGAGWTFFIWGLLHGSYLAGETLWKAWRGRKAGGSGWSHAAGMLLTFHLVTFAWVFFRAPTLEIAGSMLTSILRPTSGFDRLFAQVAPRSVAVTLGACLSYALWALAREQPTFQKLARITALRWVAYFCLFVAIALLRQGASIFLYAQF